MKVLVDTSVWSVALRRRAASSEPAVFELRELIREGRAALAGVVRQEILSGVRDPRDFGRLRDHLRAFPDEAVVTDDYERAAECLNACRVRGVQGSNTDFLLCAISERLQYPILTTDADFSRFARVLPLRRYQPRDAGHE